MDKIKPIVYGTDWCPKTTGFRNYFNIIGVKFEYHNIEDEPEAEEAVKAMNNGKIKFPMITIGKKNLKNPSIQELNKVLNENDLLMN